MRACFVLLFLLGCESSTFVDCPTFEMSSCLDTDECRYLLYGDGSGECRNRCDPFVEQPCPEGYTCDVTSYWEPGVDTGAGPVDDICVD